MNIILLSGGSGKRLWPLSNDARAKQFLKILKDENGNPESMLQRICRQIEEAGIDAKVTVSTGISQYDTINSQIGKRANIVVEPDRKNTYPAIALACASLIKEQGLTMDDVVLVLPVDPCVQMSYFQTFAKMEKLALEGKTEMVLMGIKPTYPSAKYGYIKAEKPEQLSFVEKPTEEEAAKLIEQGAFWNAGVFAFKIGYLLDKVKNDMGTNQYEELLDRFEQFENISFDYEILEKCKSLQMVPYEGKWKDLGTWNTLTEEMDSKCIGEATIGEGCENTNIINELSIPIIALGAKNLIVAASPDGILVSDKQKSSYIKPYVEELDNRPMYEERKWGEYKVLDYIQYEDKIKSLTKHLIIEAGKGISYQLHHYRDEIWTIVDGEGELLVDGNVKRVKRGDVAYIVAGQRHAMRAIKNLHFIEVQIGRELIEEDIERFEWNWE